MNPFLILKHQPAHELSLLASAMAGTPVGNWPSAYDLMTHEDEAFIYTLGELCTVAEAIGYRLLYPDLPLAVIKRAEAAKDWEMEFIVSLDSLDQVPFDLLVGAMLESAIDPGTIRLERWHA